MKYCIYVHRWSDKYKNKILHPHLQMGIDKHSLLYKLEHKSKHNQKYPAQKSTIFLFILKICVVDGFFL